jgi:short-subunit dehydrogenase
MKKYHGYALVTGGTIGIGYSIAEQLAANGYNLILIARHEDDLNKAREYFTNKYKVEVLVITKDLSQPNASKEIYDYLQEKKIHVALLVNNAGFGVFGLFADSSRESNINMVELMCRTVVDLTYLFLPGMINAGEGGIIIISSIASRTFFPRFSVYGACKTFEASFGTTLNFELQSKNIDVLVVCPSVTATQFYEKGGAAQVVENGSKNLFGLKYHSPEEVAKQAVNSLGSKILVFNGNFVDKILFYSDAFIPLKLSRAIMRLYMKYVYKQIY